MRYFLSTILLLVSIFATSQSVVNSYVFEVAAPTVYTDDFESYSTGALGGQGNWVNCSGGINVQDISGDNRVTYYNYDQFEIVRRSEAINNNQYSQVKIDVILSATYIGPCVRVTGTGATTTCYAFAISADNDAYLVYYHDESFDVIASASATVAAGDILKISANGSTITGYINGSSVVSGTNSSLATGYIGILGWYGYSGRFNYVDDWQGGNL